MRQQSRHLPAFILLLLARNPRHGGAIQTDLQQNLPVLKADSGAIYRALQQLENEGYVTAEWDTSKPGPAVKIYSITSSGWKHLDFWRQDIEARIETLQCFVAEHTRLKRNRKTRQRANNYFG